MEMTDNRNQIVENEFAFERDTSPGQSDEKKLDLKTYNSVRDDYL